jgi:hypothetical protein
VLTWTPRARRCGRHVVTFTGRSAGRLTRDERSEVAAVRDQLASSSSVIRQPSSSSSSITSGSAWIT